DRAPDDRPQLDAAAVQHRLAQRWGERPLDEAEPGRDLLVVGAVLEPPPRLPLVEVAEAAVAEAAVLDHEHRHGRGVDAGDRADAAVTVAVRDRDLAGRELALCVVQVAGKPLVDRAVEDRPAL